MTLGASAPGGNKFAGIVGRRRREGRELHRAVSVGAITAVVCDVLLTDVCPSPSCWGTGSRPVSDMLTAVLTGLIVGTIAGVLSLFAEASAAKQSAIAGISTFAVLSAGSLLLWPNEFSIFGNGERFIPLNVSFLFGFEISNHLAYVVLPISLLSAGLVWWTVRKDRMLLAA